MPYFFPNEHLLLTRLFQEGLQRLHIRKPGCSLVELQRLLQWIPAEYYPRIVLHDCFELACFYSLGGIHLNKRNNRIPTGFRGTISCSCHSLQEVQDSRSYEYVFLSPIFPSISKEGYGSGFSMQTLQEAASAHIIHSKVIALGGMDMRTIPLIQSLPFGGVAILGALWGDRPSIWHVDTILEQFKQLQTV